MKNNLTRCAKVMIAFVFFCLNSSFANQHTISVVNNPGTGYFPIVASGVAVSIVVDAMDAEVVKVAATAYSNDVNLVSGVKPLVVNTLAGTSPCVIIGTLGKSALVDTLAKKAKIQSDKVAGKWETFGIVVVENPFEGVSSALVIYGSDPRGTAYGVFELSRMMGVSPLVWWSDVTPEPKSAIYVTPGAGFFGPPSVKYRGLFINDEDWGIQPWAAKNMDTGIKDMGPKTYERIFELLLRLKANYIWPAMHDCTKAFWYYTQNPAMARKYDIVLGSSHCEPMLRDNVWEWTANFASEYGFASGEFNWATNKTNVVTYWTDRVKQSVNNDATYTVGIRGVHDGQMLGYSTDADRVVALKDVIATQRSILETQLGKPASTVPQIFCPYKEALDLYNLGLNLADDITLTWADDNFGYIRQLSNETEQLRSGGAGVYYHLSYWGSPVDYLWLSTHSTSLISSEMNKAYAMNARNLWVFNVGDIKPAEMEFQFAMDLAWDVSKWTPQNTYLYSKQWAAETFGVQFADDISKIKQEYYRLAASGKPEHLMSIIFSRREAEKRIVDYSNLVALSRQVEATIPARLKDAYFELIGYPVEAAACMNKKIFYAQKSIQLAAEGNNSALTYSNLATTAYNDIVSLTNKFNTSIAGGKWNGMMSYRPRSLSQFNAPTVATSASINPNGFPALVEDSVITIPAQKYSAKSSGAFVPDSISGLGGSGCAMTVWPLDKTTYTSSNITSAPYVEYDVPVVKGTNKIKVKCLPTFPLYSGMQLRLAMSVAGATPVFTNIATTAGSGQWSSNVLNGYTGTEVTYTSDANKTIQLRVYFADPGFVLNSISVAIPASESPYTAWLSNPDFEYSSNGILNTVYPTRGLPYGWKQTGSVAGNSFGLHNDASNYNGNTMCWYNVNQSPYAMPTKFELYQTVKGLPAGKYVVRCRLAAMSGYITNVRLFANNNVQYYGAPASYVSNLTVGETNTFASISPVSGMSKALLSEMAVCVTINAGDSLNLGIRSSNMLSDGTFATGTGSSNVYGGFKVDNFRLEKIEDLNTEDPLTADTHNFRIKTKERKLYIETEQVYDTGKVYLYALNGQKISETKISKYMNSVNVSNSGTYIVRAIINNKEKIAEIFVK